MAANEYIMIKERREKIKDIAKEREPFIEFSSSTLEELAAMPKTPTI